MNAWPIGVFTSIDAGLGVKLEVVDELNIPTIQLHAPHAPTRTEKHAQLFLDQIRSLGVELTAVFGGFNGESYADIPTVTRTVGLVPAETRQTRLEEMKHIADFAKRLGCSVVALHLGFIPEGSDSKLFSEVVEVTRVLLDYIARNDQCLHLETGQESAEGLVDFIKHVDRANLFVNFDPANMILYGTGDPIEAVRILGEYIRSVHCKDATWAENPGKEWGCEVPLGAGQVDMEEYLRALHSVGYHGPLTIEREIPSEPIRQKQEIKHAVDLLTELRSKILV
ncbi:MAG TPA: sugar phosphate isomerase/epimerase family protein [Pirellulaceae bacterium]|nr:sugar phosphate isomerase/epimerase family protein [Pirellulaceae bacterium]HMO92050.1 sugar phosphate isomerase/epimerase family protein [Pirellulaceae bacterium]HMP68849.1 sugar phosphate isomerase/epimerase family protein [Pirellulaceae bacterium]